MSRTNASIQIGTSKNMKRKTKYKRKDKNRKGEVATRQYVQQQLSNQIETKVHYWDYNTSAPLAGGIYNLLGDSGQRIQYTGDKFQILKLEIRFHVVNADSTNFVRLTTVRSKMQTGTPTFSQIFAQGQVFPWRDNFDYNNRSDYEVVRDKVVFLSNQHITSKVFTMTMWRKNWVIRTADSASPSYQGKGWPYLAMCSDSSASTHPQVNFNVRVLYRDA